MRYQNAPDFDILKAYSKADALYKQLENLDYEQAIEVVDRNQLALSDSDFMLFTWDIVKCKIEKKNGKKYGRRN